MSKKKETIVEQEPTINTYVPVSPGMGSVYTTVSANDFPKYGYVSYSEYKMNVDREARGLRRDYNYSIMERERQRIADEVKKEQNSDGSSERKKKR